MTTVDDSVNAYRQAERRLRELLLGDGTTNVGLVKGEERRLDTTRILRRMRSAFEAVVERDAGRAAEAEARLADLEEAEAQLADLEKALREALARSRHRSEAA